MDSPHITSTYAEFMLVDPRIVLIRFIRDADLDETIAVDILSNLIKLVGGDYHALIYDFNGKTVVVREITRKISSVRDERTAKLICRAIVAPSIQNKLESKHYIKEAKPNADTRYFPTFEEAFEWCKDKLKAYQHL